MIWVKEMVKMTVDRIEGEFAVCETGDRKSFQIPLFALPDGISEGDVISVEKDFGETESRKEKIEKLMNDVWSD